ncbi:MAG: hypothetical protein NVSMB52_01870 [Chloroflexota bacterium]
MKWSWRNTASAVAFTGVAISWGHFDSTLYPYSVSQPSSFRHVVVVSSADQKVDYFFPSLGSTTTNVNIFALRGNDAGDVKKFFRSEEGSHIRRVGWLRIMGRKFPLTRADFKGFSGRWAEEQISFVARGYVWRLTASYDLRFKRMRDVMLRMLRSFKLRQSGG